MKIALAAGVIFVAGIGAAQAQFGQRQNNGLYGGNSTGGYGSGSNPQSHYVAPSINQFGSTTQGHYQTNPNNTQMDNYGTRGNVNPYNGHVGTRSPKW